RMLEAQAHQDVPFERLVEALQPERVAGQNPLAQVKFVMQEDWGRLDHIGDANCVALEQIEVGARFDLALDIVTKHDGMTCEFIYAADLFDESTVARFAGQFQTILAAICDNPHGSIGAMDLVADKAYPDGAAPQANVVAHVARHAAATPEQVALVH